MGMHLNHRRRRRRRQVSARARAPPSLLNRPPPALERPNAVRAKQVRRRTTFLRRLHAVCVGRGNTIFRSWRNQGVIALDRRRFGGRFLNEATPFGETEASARSPRPSEAVRR